MRVETAAIRQFDIRRLQNGKSERAIDAVAEEEPLQIFLSYWFKGAQRHDQLAVTMRTPGQDRELAAGFLLGEGLVRKTADISGLRVTGLAPSNEIIVELNEDVDVDTWRMARSGYSGSSCGVCGKRTMHGIQAQTPSLRVDGLVASADTISKLPDLLRARQSGFERTGGLHAAALATASGCLEAVFEDVGRHNALDKLLGYSLLRGNTPLDSGIVLMSSRSSFELIQKAAMAGVPILATIGGPSSLAIETARAVGMTLIGFVREDRMNVYSGEWRIR